MERYSAPSREADLAVGSVLGGMIGDALGTCCEGWDPDDIRTFAIDKGWDSGLVRDFVPCIHMGHGGYVGPPKPGHEVYARFGMYSDDTNAALALATSLVEQQGLNGPLVARKYSEFFFDESCPTRFCPYSAEQVMADVRDGMDYRATGRRQFPDGSFANGGAMRSSPLGVAYRAAPPMSLRRAAEEAVRSSHCHPEAVDAAALQAHAVAFAMRRALAGDARAASADLLQHLRDLAQTDLMRSRLQRLVESLSEVTPITDDVSVLKAVVDDGLDPVPCQGFDFQLKAVAMMPCVFWIAARYWSDPEEALMRALAIGGDTDTTASMVGCILGAFHGTDWIPLRWWDNVENGTRGRDYAIRLGQDLSKLELRDTLTWGGL